MPLRLRGYASIMQNKANSQLSAGNSKHEIRNPKQEGLNNADFAKQTPMPAVGRKH